MRLLRDRYGPKHEMVPVGYPIQGIRSRLPSAMSDEQLASDRIILFGHPGWNRYDATQKIIENFTRLRDYFFEQVVKNEMKDDETLDMDFVNLQLAKAWMFVGSPYCLLEELMHDTVFEYAREQKIPTIVSISTRETPQGYVTNEGLGFKDYINMHIGNNPNFFVLPTDPRGGMVQSSNPVTYEDCAYFYKTPQGRRIFGRLFEKFERTVEIFGGDLDGCLDSTLFYFADQDSLKFCSDYISISADPDIQISEETRKSIRSLLYPLHKRETEKEAREQIIKLLKAAGGEQDVKKLEPLYESIIQHLYKIRRPKDRVRM